MYISNTSATVKYLYLIEEYYNAIAQLLTVIVDIKIGCPQLKSTHVGLGHSTINISLISNFHLENPISKLKTSEF